MTLAAVAALGIASVLGRSAGIPRRALVLLGLWFIVGYLFFSAIDLKEERHTVVLLFPVAVLAVAGVTRSLPCPIAPAGASVLALGTLAWTLAFAPAPRVEGYVEAARWIVDHAPPGRILFSGSRDGSFIYNFRVDDPDRRYTIVRADKLFLAIAVRRELGVRERNVTPEHLREMFHDYALRYVVAERDFWIDLHTMRSLQEFLDSDAFDELARIPVRANRNHLDRELRVYRLRAPIAAIPRPLKVDLPVINRSFEPTEKK
jgi:hypothetical protein